MSAPSQMVALRILLGAGASRAITPLRVAVRGSGIPSDTEALLRALGLSQRSQLRESKYGPSFKLAGSSPYTDTTDADFESVAESLPPAPAAFI
jgi:hypothetical protein